MKLILYLEIIVLELTKKNVICIEIPDLQLLNMGYAYYTSCFKSIVFNYY